jgi:hypothetical protein
MAGKAETKIAVDIDIDRDISSPRRGTAAAMNREVTGGA